MKTIFALLITVFMTASIAHAEDTMGKKTDNAAESTKDSAKKTGRKVKSTAKKAGHRMQEATCMEGDMECAAKKARNRVNEGADAASDTMKNTKDKVSE
ncbi:MAG: hypothetical protein OM95_16575 [Bdellovibrio sp. ArHS]|uniref:hypothetical protein n=1 Tax=Bdellovibrio sp. ArHS TaxID=1569284 RepID=UPI0005823EDD|nr:hypothetical protein [Bdellovibrio sp. ArHS]KHD87029.1 MAG: hypothetical protein OM95_16575 [Bdellovibrio sp. ArHS]